MKDLFELDESEFNVRLRESLHLTDKLELTKHQLITRIKQCNSINDIKMWCLTYYEDISEEEQKYLNERVAQANEAALMHENVDIDEEVEELRCPSCGSFEYNVVNGICYYCCSIC